jgi:hypothetical protein
VRFAVRVQKMESSRTFWSLNQMHSIADSATHNGPLSSALAGTFRGKLCDVILRDRTVTTFEKDQVIYDAADQHQGRCCDSRSDTRICDAAAALRTCHFLAMPACSLAISGLPFLTGLLTSM